MIVVPDYKSINDKLIFLAGPIRGAPNWHAAAINYINSKAPNIWVATPKGDYSNKKFDYNKQVDWETHHLNIASKKGCVLFWLAKEENHRCDMAYAQTSRFELAEWKVKHACYGANVVVGIETGFTGKKYIRRRLGQDCPSIPLANVERKRVMKRLIWLLYSLFFIPMRIFLS